MINRSTNEDPNDSNKRLDGRCNVAAKTTGRATSTEINWTIVEESGKDADRFLTEETPSDREVPSGEDSEIRDDSEVTRETDDPEKENLEQGDPGQGTPGCVEESTGEASHMASFTPDHDVLTKDGWMPIGKVSTSAEVATLDPETDDIQYQSPRATPESSRDGKMYRVKSQQIDLKVTPGHRMYVNPRNPMVNGENYARHRLMQADSIAGKRVRYKADGNWTGTSSSTTELDAIDIGRGMGRGSNSHSLSDYATKTEVPTNDLFELTGLFLAEGFTDADDSGNYRMDIVQCPDVHPGVYDRIAELFEKCGASAHECTDRVSGINKQLYSFLDKIPSGAANKRVPRWMLTCNDEHLKALFRGLHAGDGHETATGCLVYTSTSKGLCDDVQEIALKTGHAARVFQQCEAGTTVINGQVTNQQACYKTHVRTERLTPTINHSHTQEQDAQTEEFVDYSGTLHGCTVPNGVIYVRRNGKACWCGGSSRTV